MKKNNSPDHQYSSGFGGLIISLGLLTFNSFAFSQDTKTFAASLSSTASGTVMNTVALNKDSDVKKINGSNSRNAKSTEKVENSIYRQILPNGKILYTDHPLVQTNIDKKIPMESNKIGVWSALPDMQKPSPSIAFSSIAPAIKNSSNNLNNSSDLNYSSHPSVSETLDSQLVGQKNSSPEAINSLDRRSEVKAKIMSAETRLSAANLALEDIDTPLENERSMNTNGTSRLNEKYFERQKAQRTEVQEAESDLDTALSAASKTLPTGQR